MDDRHTPTIAEFAQMLERRFRMHRAWQIGVTCLSAIVVFATVYMLVLPAITLESSNEVPGIELLANGEQEDEKNEGEKNVEDVEGADDGSDPESPEPPSDGSGVADESVVASPTGMQTDSQGGGASASSQPEGDEPVTYDSPTDEVIAEGSLNDQITWRLVRDERGVRTLYVEGKGVIPNGLGPWASEAKDNVDNIVIGKGITEIGNNAFSDLGATGGVSISETVTKIGNRAFEYNDFDQEITVPGNVKTVGNGSFFRCRNIPKITFEEGVESIGSEALEESMSADGILVLPSTLKSVGTNWLYRCSALEYQVTGTEEESLFFVGKDDGVLYRYNDEERSTWAVVKYPTHQESLEYVVPEEVTSIDQQAFRYCQGLQKLTISDDCAVTVPSAAFTNTRIVEINLGDSVTFPSGINSLFESSSLLERVTLPAEVDYGANLSSVYNGCSALQEATIPASITAINDNAFNNCTSMGSLVFDAKDLTGYPQFVGAGRLSYDLVIGENVDHLSADFDIFGEYAQEVIFAPNNYLTVDEGAFSTLSSPLSSLSGELYVDNQGVVYALDETTQSATVIYCSPSVNGDPTMSITIPATVHAADGEAYTVTTVGRDAIRGAQDLTSITFQEPKNIDLFETNALANRPTLVQINGKSSVEDVQDLFKGENPDIRFGYNAFANTGLEGSSSEGDFANSMRGPQSLTVAGSGEYANASSLTLTAMKESETLAWVPSADGRETGGWSLLTGATLNISAQVNDLKAGYTYRIFAHFTEAEGVLAGFTAGQTIQYDDLSVKCYATEDPYTFCYEITPPENLSSMEFRFGALYPTLTSPGGGLVVWGEVGEPYGSDDLVDGIVPTSKIDRPADDAMVYAHWKTVRQEYTINKTARSPQIDVLAPADGSTGTLADPLVWTISFSRDATSGESPTERLGEDYVGSLTLSDTLVLPKGVSWKDDVQEAILAGKFDIVSSVPSGSTRMVTIEVGGIPVFSISNTSSDTAMGINAILDEKDPRMLVFSCMFRNNEGTPVGSSEMTLPSLTVTLYPDAVDVDMKAYDKDNPPQVSNTAKSTLRYQNSASKDIESQEANITLSADEPVLNISVESKTEQEGTVYLGENINYTVTVRNDGSLAYQKAGDHAVINKLDKNAYLKPESIEEIFKEADKKGVGFSLTIENASLAQWEDVTPAYGQDDAHKTVTTSDLEKEKTGCTLVITKDGGSYQLTIDGGEPQEAETVYDLLKNAGYDVTTNATYTCTWTLSEEDDTFSLGGGADITFEVPATVKDTFQHLSGAMNTEMPEENLISVTDTASLKGPGINKSDSVTDRFTREARVEKTLEVFRNGESLGSGLGGLQDLDILDYTVDLTHWGNGTYENLPIVDSISGAQRLLVPVVENASLEDRGLGTVIFDGIVYYILDQKGTYTNVVVGVASGLDGEQDGYWTAAKITVGEGTSIEWYATDLPAHAYNLDLGYQTIVQASSSGGSFTVGNVVRTNGRDSSNLYTTISGGGTMVSYSKQIVSTRGTTPDDDTFYADQYSPVKEGQEVTYRLTITNNNASTYTVLAKSIADALPHTNGKFEWRKASGADDGNIKIVFDDNGGVTWNNRDGWYIGGSYLPDGAHSSNSYILWPEGADLQLETGATAYVYVTLTYPTGQEWQDYVDAVNGNPITNTLWVYDHRDIVTHDLDEQGYALLQKGVFATHDNGTRSGVRDTYSTSYGRDCGVVYYVALLNSGAKRLYINDIQDQLPRGFSFSRLLGTPDSSANPATTVGGKASDVTSSFITFTGGDANDITYVSARVSASASGRNLRFRVVDSGSGDYAISYDEEREKYYLERNQALVFAYEVDVSQQVADTDAANALNTVAMPYTDFTTSGVASVDSEGAKYAGVDIAVRGYTDLGTYQHGTNDDMEPDVFKSDYVLNGGYGFTDDVDANQWLMSQVGIDRGDIELRTEKRIDSYTTPGSDTVIPYTGSITAPNATSNWTIRAYNDGDCTVQGYVFTDKLPNGFTFVGNVAQSVVRNKAGQLINSDSTGYFSIMEHDPDAKTIQIKLRGTEGYEEVPTDGSWYRYDDNLSFRIYFDKDGCEVLQLFAGFGPRLIPPGGYAEFTFSAVNPSTTQASGVYQNIAYTTPVRQEPSEDDHEDLVQVNLGELNSYNVNNIQNTDGWSAEGDAVMNVTLSATTTSSKTVTEQLPPGEEGNTATSNWTRQSIRLKGNMGSEGYGSLRYELAVDNGVNASLEKLVLIDTLPREGDSNPLGGGSGRGSEFAVHLAENPDFKVTTQNGDEIAQELRPSAYRLEYMTSETSFDEDDWNGERSGWTPIDDQTDWSAIAESVTALRVVINGEDALPTGVKVRVSFNAQVADDAGADEVAWNSFGYRGVYNNGTSSFEAMPEPVGVLTPAVPVLRKTIVDSQNNAAPVTNDADAEFKFLLYEGDTITDLDVTEGGWENKLAGKVYRVLSLTVPAGQFRADLELTPSIIASASGEPDKSWIWEQGIRYNVVELPTSDGLYSFGSFAGGTGNFYTFTYDRDEERLITCTNTYNVWSITLKKVDGDTNKPLSGSTFALYSPDEADVLAEEEVPEGVSRTQTISGNTYYLMSVKKIEGEEASHTWDELIRSSYYLLEVEAPEGYALPVQGTMLYRRDANAGSYVFTAYNFTSFELPLTGGSGRAALIGCGAAIAVASVGALFWKRRRGEGGAH